MAHFAKINDDNEVLTVLTLDNKDTLNDDNVEEESVGQQYLQTHNNTHRLGGTAFRGNYAGIGFTWDSSNNIFWPPKPYTSWVKNTTTAAWDAPVTKPQLTAEQLSQNTQPDATTPATHAWCYVWNEANQSWDLTNAFA